MIQLDSVLTDCLFLDVCCQDIQASENPLPVGSNVTLYSKEVVRLGTWVFNNRMVVFIFSGNYSITSPWIKRASFNVTTSALTLRSLTLEDSGQYTLQDINGFTGDLKLSVQGKRFPPFPVYPLTHSTIHIKFILHTQVYRQILQ